ncbi:MAG: helix-turn-helix domain-containing protein [Proteobacteria bacterium]|nr:helix-turn-helix domain-containing protein [Pseudomonadota bacterium]
MQLINIPQSNPMAKITTGYIKSLNQHADALAAGVKQKMAANLLDLMATTIAASIDTKHTLEPSVLQAARLETIRQFIKVNSDEPTLSPEFIARAHHISVSYLHKLFQKADTTVGRYIRKQRLRKCYYDLACPENQGHQISEIAYARGFNELCYFSRVFKTHFGITAKEWKASAYDKKEMSSE